MSQQLPKDPVMLLSFVNTQLRDQDTSLEELCARYQVDKKELEKKLSGIGYHYDCEKNQFR